VPQQVYRQVRKTVTTRVLVGRRLVLRRQVVLVDVPVMVRVQKSVTVPVRVHGRIVNRTRVSWVSVPLMR
jgi:hypothetical protein